ncbi:ABC transporter ATP-binding protein [Kurthia sibirica]|uniref:Dipeptide/oligopeptide/nickel ABC transporter ATP-binding protein n=1 Tax=Kurthia sibirica TaxID=202750 RepID=A0A2U3ANQ0_9BACL|nr:ABC transporter ATP-binding protein [Kurthia sibirica]PWI26157.1 dipeptide/oligopeptide/nickel ABC transporter ATP-binding protein [Kurthia sibirica]GEK33416.1 dipeptide/oligopeptide/nickel ABC transporter ATP-binding protein [Kurthia sibirica]
MNTSKELLTIKNLHTSFRIKDQYFAAIEDINLTLKENEILAIVGESGCGKSTLATSIVGLHQEGNTKVDGEILYNGLNLANMKDDDFNKIRGNDIGFIFQDPLAALNPLMRIGDQIAETLKYHTKKTEKERQVRVLELLNQVGIHNPERIAKQYPHQLSGGMRQRVVIAIAIACKPKIMIADEPTTALDVTIQAQILDLLGDLQEETNAGIILITHDLGVVAEVADRVAVMYAGQIIELASVEELFASPKHPYTRSLLNSIPQIDSDNDRLEVIKGMVPSLVKMDRKGCRFAPRIPWIDESKHEDHPQLHEIAKDHLVRCTCWKDFHFEHEEGGLHHELHAN